MPEAEPATVAADCVACRLSSGGVISLASLYVAYHGVRRPKPVERSLMLAVAGAVMKPLDAYIVEDHNEALTWIYRQIGAKRLPVHDTALLHLDSHPDLLLPARLTADEATCRDALLPRLSIGDWILPAVFAGHIGRVLWLRPPWARQLADGAVTCHIGLDARRVVRLDAGQPYFVSEQLYAPVDELTDVREFRLVVATLDGETDVPRLAASLGAHLAGAPFVLDVDLDFFSTRDPFLDLLAKADVHARLRRLFSLPAAAGDDAAAAQRGRRALMTEARAIFDHVVATGGLDGYSGPETPLLSDLRQLVTDVNQHYSPAEVDWELVYDAACTFDVDGLPHHVSTAEQVAASITQVGELLAALPEPGAITVARSSLDNYCPADQVDGIQSRLLDCLRRRFSRLAVHHKYDQT